MDTSKLKGLWEKVKDFFKNMSKKLRIILAAALAVILIAIVVTAALLGGKKEYVSLYEDMTPAEAQEVTTYLQNSGFTNYQVVNNSVMVPEAQYASLIAQLAQQGYPKDGSLYGSYWDHVGAMSTNSERQTAFLIATQEKLETAIRTMPNVLDAQVTITPGQERTYVLEDISTQTVATVFVNMRSGQVLTDQQANGIRTMVSHAWTGMTIDDVSITDNVGNTYSDTSGNADTLIELKRRLEESQSNYIRTQIKHLLDDAFGPDNVKVSVTATVDVSERVVESTTYHQPDGSTENGGLIGHEMGYFALTRDGYQLVGGVPGTTSNSDLPTYVEDIAQDTQDGDGVVSSWENDHKIDETKEQVRVAPSVVDLSVAVTINANADSAANVDVAQLQHHIAVGANIGGGRSGLEGQRHADSLPGGARARGPDRPDPAGVRALRADRPGRAAADRYPGGRDHQHPQKEEEAAGGRGPADHSGAAQRAGRLRRTQRAWRDAAAGRGGRGPAADRRRGYYGYQYREEHGAA